MIIKSVSAWCVGNVAKNMLATISCAEESAAAAALISCVVRKFLQHCPKLGLYRFRGDR